MAKTTGSEKNCEASGFRPRRPTHPVICFACVPGERGTKGSLIQCRASGGAGDLLLVIGKESPAKLPPFAGRPTGLNQRLHTARQQGAGTPSARPPPTIHSNRAPGTPRRLWSRVEHPGLDAGPDALDDPFGPVDLLGIGGAGRTCEPLGSSAWSRQRLIRIKACTNSKIIATWCLTRC